MVLLIENYISSNDIEEGIGEENFDENWFQKRLEKEFKKVGCEG